MLPYYQLASLVVNSKLIALKVLTRSCDCPRGRDPAFYIHRSVTPVLQYYY
ncbi:hypothetical protein PZA11_008016 [Diplocarpon coronariae]